MGNFEVIVEKNRLNLGEHVPKKVPFVVVIEPSGYCNFKCKFCPQYGGGKCKG